MSTLILLNIVKDSRIKLYGLNFTDDRSAALRWLEQYQDPYVFSIFDEQGALGLDIGGFGAPETFVIDHTGIIRKRFAGPINDKIWQKEFVPLVETLEVERKAALANQCGEGPRCFIMNFALNDKKCRQASTARSVLVSVYYC